MPLRWIPSRLRIFPLPFHPPVALIGSAWDHDVTLLFSCEHSYPLNTNLARDRCLTYIDTKDCRHTFSLLLYQRQQHLAALCRQHNARSLQDRARKITPSGAGEQGSRALSKFGQQSFSARRKTDMPPSSLFPARFMTNCSLNFTNNFHWA